MTTQTPQSCITPDPEVTDLYSDEPIRGWHTWPGRLEWWLIRHSALVDVACYVVLALAVIAFFVVLGRFLDSTRGM